MFTDYQENMLCKFSMKYKSGTSAKNNKDWEGAFLSAKFGDVWLNPRPLFFPTGDSEYAEKDEARIFQIFDHIAEVFLPAASAKDLKVGSPTLRDYYNSMEQEMKELKFWNRPVYIKLIPDKDGTAAFGSIPFLSMKPNLKYTDAEKALVTDNITHDSKQPKYNGGAVAAEIGEDEEDTLPF